LSIERRSCGSPPASPALARVIGAKSMANQSLAPRKDVNVGKPQTGRGFYLDEGLFFGNRRPVPREGGIRAGYASAQAWCMA